MLGASGTNHGKKTARKSQAAACTSDFRHAAHTGSQWLSVHQNRHAKKERNEVSARISSTTRTILSLTFPRIDIKVRQG
jgi:hypothetical protein